MKTNLFLAITLCFLLLVGCAEKNEADRKIKTNNTPKISILGVFHFAGTSDFSSVEFESLESETRQKEIKDVIEKLKTYNPTKIMLEFPYSDSKYLDSLYNETLKGNHTLTINEIEQLGFRLAQELDHKHVYSIDYRLDLPFDELLGFAKKHDKERLDKMIAHVQAQDKTESDFLLKNTILDYLIYRNSDEEDKRNKEQYLNRSAKFVSDSSDVGAKFVSEWWKRNIYMMTYIDRQVDSDDRVLVIVGAAHRAVLKDLYQDRTDIEYLEISNYLK